MDLIHLKPNHRKICSLVINMFIQFNSSRTEKLTYKLANFKHFCILIFLGNAYKLLLPWDLRQWVNSQI